MINKTAPDFKGDAFIDNNIKKISLSDYKGKWVILFFYPADFTFICPTELGELADKYEEFKKELENLAKESKEAKKLLELESGLSTVQKEKDDLTREIGKIDGFIIAEERIIDNEKKLSASDELKTVRLKEVEGLYEDIKNLQDLKMVKDKIESFITERKHATNSELISEAHARIKELKKQQADFEEKLIIIKKKEYEISEAEKAVFRTKSLENELGSKLNLLKSREDSLSLIEEELRRELQEIGHLVGSVVFKFEHGGDASVPVSREEQEASKRNIQKLKIRLEDSSISGMEEVAKEYKDTSERDEFLARELLDLEKSAQTLAELIKELETRLAVEFSSGLENINKEFGKLFVSMFGGGEASLILTKEVSRKQTEFEDVEEGMPSEALAEEGLDIKVNLPKKKIRGLVMLSGGERALTSIALIFAVSQVNPPPFIILDETDAALDESNSKKYGDLVEILSKHSQLILITHNRETMSRAGVIYGVTMGSNGISKLLSISFDEAVEAAK